MNSINEIHNLYLLQESQINKHKTLGYPYLISSSHSRPPNLCPEAMVYCLNKNRIFIQIMSMLDGLLRGLMNRNCEVPDTPSKRWKEDRLLVITRLYSMR